VTRTPEATQQAITLPSDGIDLLVVREGKQGAGSLQGGGRRLGKTVVELPAPGASNVRHNPVEDHSVSFVSIEAEIEEMTQETAALRSPKPVGIINVPGTRVVLLVRHIL